MIKSNIKTKLKNQEGKQFLLEKAVWTEADFENMGWHDASIHGLTVGNSSNSWTGDLFLDIDYIFEWVHPKPNEKHFSFWIAPCTLKFIEAFNLNIQIDSADYTLDTFEIADIHLTKDETHMDSLVFEWKIELQHGEIFLKSKGFIQIVRREPILIEEQALSLEQRGGISFSEVPFKINPQL